MSGMRRLRVPAGLIREGIRITCRVSTPSVPWDVQRRRLDQVLNVRPLPRGTSVTPAVLGGVPAEVVTSGAGDGATVVHFHGGGYCVGSPAVGRQWAAHLSARAGCRVILPDYRLAPEHPFPVPLEDSRAALRAVLSAEPPGPVFVSGDSAGGGLALTLAREETRLAGCILLSPWLDLTADRAAIPDLLRRDVMLSPARIETFAGAYARNEDRARPEISPLHADLGGLPRLLVQYGADDLLAPDSERLADRARAAGVEVTCTSWPGMWHDFMLLAGLIAAADPAVRQAADFITRSIHRPAWQLPCCFMQGYGRGIATISTCHGVTLDVWFRDLSLEGPPESPLVLERAGDEERAVRFEVVDVAVDLDTAPGSAADAYLRLHLLSARLVQPRGLNVDGIFGCLQAVAWTDLGSVHPGDLAGLRERSRTAGKPLTVHSIDKFPRMTDFVSPPGVRIADASRVRLGAYLAEGTVVMHEGLVNFNAGTLGPCMVEGRITQGSVVDEGADIGAGSSIMGTLSGGGSHMSRIGKRCLLGANAGTGVSLGDDSAVEAGLYITRGTLVSLPDGCVVKAIELSGAPGILFRRNSVSGAVEAVPWKSSTFTGLNDALHA